jgi:hypothetical protein
VPRNCRSTVVVFDGLLYDLDDSALALSADLLCALECEQRKLRRWWRFRLAVQFSLPENVSELQLLGCER